MVCGVVLELLIGAATAACIHILPMIQCAGGMGGTDDYLISWRQVAAYYVTLFNSYVLSCAISSLQWYPVQCASGWYSHYSLLTLLLWHWFRFWLCFWVVLVVSVKRCPVRMSILEASA